MASQVGTHGQRTKANSIPYLSRYRHLKNSYRTTSRLRRDELNDISHTFHSWQNLSVRPRQTRLGVFYLTEPHQSVGQNWRQLLLLAEVRYHRGEVKILHYNQRMSSSNQVSSPLAYLPYKGTPPRWRIVQKCVRWLVDWKSGYWWRALGVECVLMIES